MSKKSGNSGEDMKKLFGEFKKFISKGNIIDLSVAVVIGGSFSKIVTSLVNDIIMPFLALIMGKNNLTDLVFVINEKVSIKYGSFLQVIIDFLVIALTIFMGLKIYQSLKKRGEKTKRKLDEIHKKLESKLKLTHKEEKALEAEVVLIEEKKVEISSTDSLLIEIRDLLKNSKEKTK